MSDNVLPNEKFTMEESISKFEKAISDKDARSDAETFMSDYVYNFSDSALNRRFNV